MLLAVVALLSTRLRRLDNHRARVLTRLLLATIVLLAAAAVVRSFHTA